MTFLSRTTTNDIRADGNEADALDRYRKLASLIDAGVYQLDGAGEFVAVSDGILEMTGYARDDILGEPLSFLFEGGAVDQIEREMGDLPDEDDAITIATVSTRRSGDRTFRCELRISSLRTDEGAQVTIGILRPLATWNRHTT